MKCDQITNSRMVTLMLGVSYVVEVLVPGLLVVVSDSIQSCIFNTVVVVDCVIFVHGFSR